jgi:two-component system, cell cycle response regulator
MFGVVLLIDGDRDTREILKALLEWKGYRALESEGVDDGLRAAHDQQPALIVSEFLIPPVRQGRCVVEELRLNPRTAAIPTIVFTANRFPESRRRIEAAGAVYLEKPASPHIVLHAIERLIPAIAR